MQVMAREREQTWGRNLRSIRQATGISQSELARRLGVTAATVSQWESGRRAPRDTHRIAIAEFFGVPVDDLFSLEGW